MLNTVLRIVMVILRLVVGRNGRRRGVDAPGL